MGIAAHEGVQTNGVDPEYGDWTQEQVDALRARSELKFRYLDMDHPPEDLDAFIGVGGPVKVISTLRHPELAALVSYEAEVITITDLNSRQETEEIRHSAAA